MWVGVPEWRLPRDVITEEVEQILDLGIDIHYNTEIGKDISFTDLVEQFDVVLISAGCQIAQEIGIPGEDLNGVVSGIGFLEDVNLGTEGCLGRQARRDRRWWIHLDGLRAHRAAHGRRALGDDLSPLDPGNPGRGIRAPRGRDRRRRDQYMVSPHRVVGDADGKVIGIEMIRNELGAPDARGRRRPEPVPGFGIHHRMRHGDLAPSVSGRTTPSWATRCRTATAAAFRCSIRICAPSCRMSGRPATM